jgi:ferric-dicitrate binding protein FerR (iron transport regulator)
MEALVSRLEDLGSHVAEHQDAQRRKVATGAWSRERFVNAAAALPLASASETRAGAGGRRKVALFAGLAAAAGLIPLLYLARPGKPLTFTVGECSAEACAGGTVSAVGGQSLPLQFSDGTRFDLEPAASARVLETNAHGARVAVDRGRARIAVPPGRGGRWSVEAGPYRVLITGTRLDVAWRANDEQLTVSLHEGQVRVSGGNLPAEVAVRAGQTLTASMRGDRWRMDTTAATEESAPPSAPVPPSAPAAVETPPSAGSPARAPVAAAAAPRTTAALPHAAPARSAPAAPTSAPAPAPQWRQLAARGDFQAAVQQADAEGFDLLCQRASARDLLALSEAARFAGQPARAKAALLSLRRRFSGRPEAAVAGFVLGRLAFDDEHDYRAAGRWFRGYLDGNSTGPLSREAAGRRVEALV